METLTETPAAEAVVAEAEAVVEAAERALKRGRALRFMVVYLDPTDETVKSVIEDGQEVAFNEEAEAHAFIEADDDLADCTVVTSFKRKYRRASRLAGATEAVALS